MGLPYLINNGAFAMPEPRDDAPEPLERSAYETAADTAARETRELCEENENLRDRLKAAEDGLAIARDARVKLTAEVYGLRADRDVADRRIAHLNMRDHAASVELGELREVVAEQKARLAELRAAAREAMAHAGDMRALHASVLIGMLIGGGGK